MILTPLPITGAYLATDNTFKDNRGVFTESWESKQFLEQGIIFYPSNSCFSLNLSKNTLRGLHYQLESHGQSKLVSCVAGAIYDVIVDLRSESASHMKWHAVRLTSFMGNSVYIPKGCAHGFMTLDDNSVVSYLIEGEYSPASARTIRWDDPVFGIDWPMNDPIISEKDKNVSVYGM
jgi:dTDP-4-dehydrorhamnose 3,5-epimerase